MGHLKILKKLTQDLSGIGIKVMLDGVFNHVGVSNPIYQNALKDKKSPYRKWFDFSDKYEEGGVRLWQMRKVYLN